jgi:SpoIID/LytB domain protein
VSGGPLLRVGLVSDVSEARLRLEGSYRTDAGQAVEAGEYVVSREGDGLLLASGPLRLRAERSLRLEPGDPASARLTVHDVTIGKDFHWQRRESQQFQGALRSVASGAGLVLVNELPLEDYLVSVVSSEMRASCPPELLRAHAVVSRSWLLAQLERAKAPAVAQATRGHDASGERIRWYDRENHDGFDVCADDHCQRYQGVGKAFSPEASQAVSATRGLALTHGGRVCDARYSKCCGGRTEVFATAWEDREVSYLQSVYDGPGAAPAEAVSLEDPARAEAWILASPPAYCRRNDREFLSRVLPGFDQETRDFYRWEVSYSQEELGAIVEARLGAGLGRILALEPLERGPSGRLVRLRIRGEASSLVVGKELEVRRALSRSHLYSSAFVVTAEAPDRIRLRGAGWGHGVGLCQIGAAAMADEGRSHEEILGHYFRGAVLRAAY